MRRGMGGRDREAARFAVRAQAIEALAQDEVRAVAGLRRRRLHRRAGQACRTRRAARRLLRGRRLRLRRQGRHRVRHEAARPSCARGSTRSRSRRRRSRRRKGCRASARTGCGRRSSCTWRSSNGRCTGSCGTRGSSASGPTCGRATSCGSSHAANERDRDHASREGDVPGRRHHQGRAGGVLRAASRRSCCRISPGAP